MESGFSLEKIPRPKRKDEGKYMFIISIRERRRHHFQNKVEDTHPHLALQIFLGTLCYCCMIVLLPCTFSNMPQGSKGPNNQVLGFRIVVMQVRILESI